MAEQMPEYQASQQVQTGSMQDIGGSMSNFADSNNWLGQLGARATMNGSVSIMKAMGYQAGMNPHGDALPAITKADEAYVNAYNQQSQMTLSAQANELRMQAQTELAKAYKLTPELVMQYEETVGQGLEKIASMAPREVAQELRFKMANSMINDSALLNQKMASQNKQDTFDLWKYSKAQDLRSIFDTGVSGDSAVAHALYEKQLDDNAANRATGLITAEEERAANDAARNTYLNGKYTGLAMQARSEGREAEFLADFGENKPKELTFEEWPSVAQSMASYIANLDKLQSEQRQVKSSEYLLKLTENPLAVTDTDLSELKGILTPTQMNNLAAKTIIAQRKAMKDMAEQRIAVDGYTDADSFSQMNAKQKNGAFHSLVSNAMQAAKDNGDVLEAFDAETMVAADAGGEVPDYTKKLGAMLRSPDVNLMNKAVNAFELIHNRYNAPQNLGSLLSDSQAMSLMYAYKAAAESMPQEQALETAREAVFNSGPDAVKQANESYNAYMKQKRVAGDTPSMTALRLLGIGNKVPIANPNLMGYKMEQLLRGNYLSTKSFPAAIEMTQAAVNRSYGITEFHGEKQMVYMPLERTTGIPADGRGIIQHDAYNQMRIQLESMKKEYDLGRINTWIEPPDTRTAQDILAFAEKNKDLLNRKSIKGMEFDKLMEYAQTYKQGADFLAGGQMTATRHTRDPSTGKVTSEEIELDIVAMNNLQLVNGGEVIGGYEIVQKMQNGFQSLSTFYGRPLPITYNPNPAQLQRDYVALVQAIRPMESAREVFDRINAELQGKRAATRGSLDDYMDEARRQAALRLR